MTHDLGAELADMGPWEGLPDIDERVTRVLCSGGLIQLLTECEATRRLLSETGEHQSGKLKELFSRLRKDDKRYDYDRAVAWLAFSYTCAYTTKLINSAGADEAAFAGRTAALTEVAANRDTLLMALIDDPGVLFAGADKPMKKLVKIDVLRGVATPAASVVVSKLHELNDLLREATWRSIGDDEWLKLRGSHYRALWYNLTHLGFVADGQKIIEAEALLNPAIVQKTVQHCRITLEDGSHREQAGGDFVQRITSLRYGLDGDKCEYDTANMATTLAGDAHWQDKVVDWRLGTGGNRKIYYGEIHPKITQYVLSILPFTPTPGRVTILDIAGGNGDLAERIIRELAAQLFAEVRLTYILVDYSGADVAIAANRFQRFQDMKLPSDFHVQATALPRNMLDYGYDARRALQDFGIPDGADIIINSGGLLNNQIGDDKQTPVKFNRMYAQLLKPGGYGVYSGLTPLLVNAATHRAGGLKVINLYEPEVDRQMHVVQRPK